MICLIPCLLKMHVVAINMPKLVHMYKYMPHSLISAAMAGTKGALILSSKEK